MEWRIIPFLPHYDISEFGDVRRNVAGRTRRAGTIAKGSVDQDGYRCFHLMSSDGGKCTWKAHRLVALVFIGPAPAGKPHVAHWDGNPSNNHFSNLRWATCQENLADRVRHGTAPRGERNPRAVMSAAAVAQVREAYTGAYGEMARMSRDLNIPYSRLADVLAGRSWVNHEIIEG